MKNSKSLYCVLILATENLLRNKPEELLGQLSSVVQSGFFQWTKQYCTLHRATCTHPYMSENIKTTYIFFLTLHYTFTNTTELMLNPDDVY